MELDGQIVTNCTDEQMHVTNYILVPTVLTILYIFSVDILNATVYYGLILNRIKQQVCIHFKFSNLGKYPNVKVTYISILSKKNKFFL